MTDPRILVGNCLERLKELADDSVDSIVTDPPYELGFMGKKWDASGIAYNVELWQEALRVLKPGGHLLAFGGTRTYHRMAVAIEDAGFEIRDSIHWITGSGFPKSLNINKAVGDLACTCGIEWSHGTGHPVSEHGVRSVQHADLSEAVNAFEATGEVLFQGVQESSSPQHGQPRSESEIADGEQSGLEGRSDLSARERQLHRAKVRSMPEGISANGAQGPLHHGTSPSNGDMDWQTAGSIRSGESHQPQSEGQPARESGTVSKQRGSQEGRGWPICGRCGKPVLPQGLGTALKPAHEPIVVARKPLVGTVAGNVLRWGVGGLNIDGTRVAMGDEYDPTKIQRQQSRGEGAIDGAFGAGSLVGKEIPTYKPGGRWPANVVFTHNHDCQQTGTRSDSYQINRLEEWSGFGQKERPDYEGSKQETTVGVWECTAGCPVAELPEARGLIGMKKLEGGFRFGNSNTNDKQKHFQGTSDKGSAARFFTQANWDAEVDVPFRYVAKPGKKERNAGLDALTKPDFGGVGIRGQNPDPYEVRVYDPDPQTIAAYLKEWREKAGVSKNQADQAIGGSTLYSWFEGRPAGIQLPTPEMWRKLKELFGFDDRHDEKMLTTTLVEKSGFTNSQPTANTHPTVKPVALMRWLICLVTPPNGTVLDPFLGSGTTAVGATLEGFNWIGCELTEDYLPIIEGRVAWAEQQASIPKPEDDLQELPL